MEIQVSSMHDNIFQERKEKSQEWGWRAQYLISQQLLMLLQRTLAQLPAPTLSGSQTPVTQFHRPSAPFWSLWALQAHGAHNDKQAHIYIRITYA